MWAQKLLAAALMPMHPQLMLLPLLMVSEWKARLQLLQLSHGLELAQMQLLQLQGCQQQQCCLAQMRQPLLLLSGPQTLLAPVQPAQRELH